GGWRIVPGQAGPGAFPPEAVAEVKAIACQLPSERGVPLSRFSSAEIAREAIKRWIVEQVSGATAWRWLAEDAIRPWNHRSWIFPRDPDFRAKAARVLDLYAGRFEGKLLHPGEFERYLRIRGFGRRAFCAGPALLHCSGR